MKKNTIAKPLLFASAIVASLFAVNLQAKEECHAASLPVFESDLVSVDPFTRIDYEASLLRLPEQQRLVARDLYQQLQDIEQQVGSAVEIDIETETKMLVLTSRLDTIFFEAELNLVEIDLLKTLSPDQQLQALKLWRDLQMDINVFDQELVMDEAQAKAMDTKYQQLEAILANAGA